MGEDRQSSVNVSNTEKLQGSGHRETEYLHRFLFYALLGSVEVMRIFSGEDVGDRRSCIEISLQFLSRMMSREWVRARNLCSVPSDTM